MSWYKILGSSINKISLPFINYVIEDVFQTMIFFLFVCLWIAEDLKRKISVPAIMGMHMRETKRDGSSEKPLLVYIRISSS